MKANWQIARLKPHDSSGIKNPWAYKWALSGGIYYPVEKHELKITYYLFADEDLIDLYESDGVDALRAEIKRTCKLFDKLPFIHGQTDPNYLLLINSGFVSYCTMSEEDFLKL